MSMGWYWLLCLKRLKPTRAVKTARGVRVPTTSNTPPSLRRPAWILRVAGVPQPQ